MASLREMIMQIQMNGLAGTGRILRYTAQRDTFDRAYKAKRAAHRVTAPRSPGKLVDVSPLAEGALTVGAAFTFEHARLEARFLAADLLRLSWTPGKAPVAYALAKEDWPPAAVELLRQTGDNGPLTRLSTAALHLEVYPDGRLRFLDGEETLLRSVEPPQFQDTLEGPAWTDVCRLKPEEHLYGLGERAGRLNWRGETRRIWNSDPQGAYKPGDDPLYMPMPVYLGLHRQGSYLVFYENYYPASFSSPPLDSSDDALLSAAFEGGMLRSYFIPGPLPHAIERLTELTGRAPLPPAWALGYHQSRWSYMSSAEVRQVARGFIAREMPISAIHLDIDYMDGYRVFTVDQQRFRDLKTLTDELAQDGIKTVVILDPGVKQDPQYSVYSEGVEQGVFCKLPDGKVLHGIVWPGWSAFPDFTDPRTRQWWGSYYPRLLEQGIAGFWHDMNEPTSFTAHSGPYLPKALRHNMDGQGGNHLQGHNVYAHQMARAGYEALRQAQPERRPWLLTRSGWVGIGRYSWNWTGDSHTSWESLRIVAAVVMSAGLCGQPYNGPDIGGFSGDPSPELYIRYFQMAAFLPFFRTHSAFNTRRREPWSYGEPYTRIARQFLQLRYRLLPYFYSLAWQTSRSGHPLVRPLWWLDPQDERLWSQDDAFLLGDALLVATVLDENGMRRQVTLPAGGWYDFWDDSLYEGPTQVEIESGLEHIPVLVRAGSIVPMAENGRLTLHVYAPISSALATDEAASASGSAAALALYSDAGDGYGPQRVDHFTLQHLDNDRLALDWSGEGDYPWPYSKVELVLHGHALGLEWSAAGAPN